MLRLQLGARTFISSGSGAGDFSDHHQTLFSSPSPPSISYSTPQVKHYCRRISKPGVNYCNSSRSKDFYEYKDGDDYLEAVILMTETLLHYQMRIQGYQELIKWQPSAKLLPFSGQGKGPRTNMQTIGPEFLSQFQSPTIFLKIPCDCDEIICYQLSAFGILLTAGEYAVERLISSSLEDEGFPNHFQLVRNIVGKLGYEVKLVQIAERVDNVYYADICFHKPGTEDIRVDVRPSDAINVAKRCRAPIYVSKQIVLTDAIKIVYKTDKLRDKKSTYDVSLDSAIDGPDVLAEELHLVTKINLAVKEERYSDAAMWRDKLLELRE